MTSPHYVCRVAAAIAIMATPWIAFVIIQATLGWPDWASPVEIIAVFGCWICGGVIYGDTVEADRKSTRRGKA